MKTGTFQGGTLQSLPENHIEPFLNHLRAAGYAERTLHKKRSVTRAFARWMKRRQIAAEDLHEGHIDAFVARWPRRRKGRVKFERAAIQLFFRYLCSAADQPSLRLQKEVCAGEGLLRRYQDYLRKDRGLAENSVRVYVPFIRDLLASPSTPTGGASEEAFNTLTIRDFVLHQARNRSAEYIRLLATALRSFCRFLFLSNQTTHDLSPSVPRVCKYRQSSPPAFLSSEEVERVLKTTDQSTPSGRRDHAILLLLARLGLRAGEIVSLQLDDIRWRTAEIVVRGKGRRVDPLPLLSDIGEALAAYLREDRGVSASRHVFLRMWAPRIGLKGPAAVGHIVRRALARAGVCRSGRSAAHLFRHGLATKMIRQGASMSEISEVLRHHSQTTTAIYAQVSFEALRGVALPWPAMGGAR
jgi:site-specific recombinase XerD